MTAKLIGKYRRIQSGAKYGRKNGTAPLDCGDYGTALDTLRIRYISLLPMVHKSLKTISRIRLGVGLPY